MTEDVDQERPSRISLSEEKLRAILAEFKLELFTNLATYAPRTELELAERRVNELIVNLSARVFQIEIWRAGRDGSNSTRRDITARQLAWAAVISAILGSLATLVWLSHG